MNIEKTIRDWAQRYPTRFKVENCNAKDAGVTYLAEGGDLGGVSVTTFGRNTPDDVPANLTIWVAADGTSAFAVHTDEDNHNMPNEELIFNEATSEADLITAIGESVGEFCRRYGVLEESLASSQWGQES